jgi:flagellar basal-body rod protein FlgF
MDRLIHTALSAMRAVQTRQTVIANNLANASTTGFRAEMVSVRPLWLTGPGLPDRAMASGEVPAADMTGASTNMTGRPLDVALNGDALLAVQAPNGEEGYTRRGDLQLSASGLLTTGDNHPVLGEGGPITLPPADSVRIDKDGTVWIVPPGGDANAPQKADRLKLASSAGSTVIKALDGLFRVPNGGALPGDPEASLTAGALEDSNVNATAALTEMIDASRAWETQIKLMATARDLDTSTAALMKLPA